jgi:predicted RNA-binding protein YlxR (DUF448 family)
MIKSAPQRSCLGCRQVRDKSDLLRFVLAPDLTLIPDLQAKLPGRGAYTCIKRGCLEEALRRNQFSRSFKGQVHVGSPDVLVQMVAARLEERIASYVSLANKAGKVVSGSDSVEDAIRKQNAGLVILASDVSADIGQKVIRLAARFSVPCYRALTRDKLAGLLGKGLRSAVAIASGGFVAAVTKEMERFRNFSEEGRTNE